jgi:phage shock protein PspC (stress-responsive transcriptional regulator)
MNKLVLGIKHFFEQRAYGVCSYLGNKLGIQTSRIRLFFIYISFLTVGSPLIIYFIMVFLLNLKKYVNSKRGRVWDL